MTPRLYAIPLAAALTSCLAAGAPPVELERSVALAALADELALAPEQDTVYLLKELRGNTAQASDSVAWLEQLLPARFRARVPTALFYRYWAANRTSASLGRFDRIAGRPVRRLTELREPTLPSSGAYSLSRVGFAATSDSALVEVSVACRGLCGSENLYLYLKGPAGWRRHRNLRSLVH